MEISYWAGTGQRWDDLLRNCRWAEATGWCGIWVPDHFMPPAGGYGVVPGSEDSELGPILEAFSVQAALAASVPRVRIGAMVAGNTYRHPAVVAKMAATIDHISDGRFVLGLGAGWQQNEHEHYGIELGSLKERSDRLAEACEVITGLLAEPRTTFAGEFYRIVDAPAEPKPVEDRIPLLRTVARWADEIRKSACAFLRIYDDEAEAASQRDRLGHRGGLVGTADELAETIEAYRAIGVDELVIPDFGAAAAIQKAMFERFVTEIFTG